MKRFNYLDRNNDIGHYIPSTLNSKALRHKSPTKEVSDTYSRLYSKEKIASPDKSIGSSMNKSQARKKSVSNSRSDSYSVNLEQVKSLMRNCDYKTAMEHLKILKSRSSRNPDISFYSAVCLMAENKLAEAIQVRAKFY